MPAKWHHLTYGRVDEINMPRLRAALDAFHHVLGALASPPGMRVQRGSDPREADGLECRAQDSRAVAGDAPESFAAGARNPLAPVFVDLDGQERCR